MKPRKFILTKDVLLPDSEKLLKGTELYTYWGYVGEQKLGIEFLTLDPTGGKEDGNCIGIPSDCVKQVLDL